MLSMTTKATFTVGGINPPVALPIYGGRWATLRECYEYTCDQYARKFCEMYDYDYDDSCWWAASEVGGVFVVNDLAYTLDMNDLIYAVDHQVSKKDFDEWLEYTYECDSPLHSLSLRAYLNIKQLNDKNNPNHERNS